MKYILSLILISSINFAYAKSGAGGAGESYEQKISKLETLDGRVATAKKELQELMVKKNATEGSDAKAKVFSQIVVKHKQLEELKGEYNSLEREIRFKFPAKKDKSKRQYLPMKNESIEEIENDTGIDSIMTRVKLKVDKKYETFVRKDLDKPKDKSIEPKSKKKKKRLKLVK